MFLLSAVWGLYPLDPGVGSLVGVTLPFKYFQDQTAFSDLVLNLVTLVTHLTRNFQMTFDTSDPHDSFFSSSAYIRSVLSTSPPPTPRPFPRLLCFGRSVPKLDGDFRMPRSVPGSHPWVLSGLCHHKWQSRKPSCSLLNGFSGFATGTCEASSSSLSLLFGCSNMSGALSADTGH